MKQFTLFLCLLVSTFASSISSAQELKAGKSIYVSIIGFPAEKKARIDGVYQVADDGTVNMPIIGKVTVSGMKYVDAASLMATAYCKTQNSLTASIYVCAAEKGEFTVNPITVVGFVHKPGPKNFVSGMTLRDALDAAGGANEHANLNYVVLMRGKSAKIYNFRKSENINILLEPGDYVEVAAPTIITR